MFKLNPIKPRVQKLRNRYRETIPTLDAERARILTELLKENRDDVPVIKQARVLHAILANMTVGLSLMNCLWETWQKISAVAASGLNSAARDGLLKSWTAVFLIKRKQETA